MKSGIPCMQREALKYLYDILAAAEKVQRFVAGSSEDDYLSDELLQSAVERQFEIIGEAIGKLHKIAPDEAERFVDYKKDDRISERAYPRLCDYRSGDCLGCGGKQSE